MSSAGQAVGGVVGAVAGFFLGGGPTGALYGAQAGMMLGGLLHPPKGPTVDGPRLNDLSVQTSTYGAVIPRVYGAITVDGNVFWLENNSIKETITKFQSTPLSDEGRIPSAPNAGKQWAICLGCANLRWMGKV